MTTAFFECERPLRSFVARFLPHAPDIDDIVQEVFLRAYHAGRDRPVEAPRAYLFRIARNLSLRELERRARYGENHSHTSGKAYPLADHPLQFDASEVASQDAPLDEQVGGRDMLAAFCRVAASLPPQCRRAFLMRKIDGLPYREVADELGVSVKTVEKHVAAGVQRCSTYLGRLGHRFSLPAPRRAAAAQ